MKCPFCNAECEKVVEDFDSGTVIVNDVHFYRCTDPECAHSWLPADQERIIDDEVARVAKGKDRGDG